VLFHNALPTLHQITEDRVSFWAGRQETSMKRIVIVILGIIAFGILMALREEAVGLWLRAGIAALAGACLVVSFAYAQRRTP
jgi:hypothetical protein